MYILTDKDNVIMHIANTVGRQEENNYYLLNENTNMALAIPPEFVKSVYEVAVTPQNVSKQRYCYSPEQGFFKNENFVKHYSNEERLNALEDIVNMLVLGGIQHE